jgi:uncharacterized protein YggE
MRESKAKYFFVVMLMGVFALLAVACSSQVPVSTTVGGAQVGEETAAIIQNGGGQEAVGAGPEEVEATVEMTKDPAPTVAPVEVASSTESGVVASPDLSGTNAGGGSKFPAQASERDSAGATGIVVSGSGRASAAPDLAALRLGVQAIEATVGEARSAAAEAMSAVMESVGNEGVEDKDIQTGYFSIQPRYTGREITRCVEAESSEEAVTESEATTEGPAITGVAAEPKAQECFQEYRSVITGYEVSNNLTVLVRDLDTVDDVIDSAVEAGGDNIRFNGLSFSLENTKELETEARSAAVSDLEAKAGELADLAGVGLGELLYLRETGGFQPPIVRPAFALERAAADSSGGIATPISPGEVSVEVNVVGQYLIGGGE